MENYINSTAPSNTVNIEDAILNTVSKQTASKEAENFSKIFDKYSNNKNSLNPADDKRFQPAKNTSSAKENTNISKESKNNTAKSNSHTETEHNKVDDKTQTKQSSTEKPKAEESKEITAAEAETTVDTDEAQTRMSEETADLEDVYNKIIAIVDKESTDEALNNEELKEIADALKNLEQNLKENGIEIPKELQEKISEFIAVSEKANIDTNQIKNVLGDLSKQIELSLGTKNLQATKTQSTALPIQDLNQKDFTVKIAGLGTNQTPAQNTKDTEINTQAPAPTQPQPKQEASAASQPSTQTNTLPQNETVVIEAKADVVQTDPKQKSQNTQKEVYEQKIINEMNVKVENTQISDNNSSKQNSNQTGTNAQEQLIKLSIEKSDSSLKSQEVSTFGTEALKNTKTVQSVQNIQPKEINKADVLNQISSKFEQMKDGLNSKITLTLRPNDLGRLTIELSHSAQGVTTNIIAQNSQVKELLDKNIDSLKQQLAQAGVNVQNIQVKTVEQNAQTNLNNSHTNNGQNFGESNQERSSNSNTGEGRQKDNNSRQRETFSENRTYETVEEQNNTKELVTSRGKISYTL